MSKSQKEEKTSPLVHIAWPLCLDAEVMTACIMAGWGVWLLDPGHQIFNEQHLITAPIVGKCCLEVNKALCTEVFHSHLSSLPKPDELELSPVQFLTAGEGLPEK